MSDINVTIEPQVVNVVLGAEQGPSGPPGAAGSDSAVYVANGAISGHVVAAETTPGAVVPASVNNATHMLRIVGITTNASISGGNVAVQHRRTLTHPGWAFTPNALVYLGLSGALVQTPPVAQFTQVIGVAQSATSLLVSIQPPVRST